MEMDSLTCQTELLRGQSGNIVRMFVDPRQDKVANLLPSGVRWRSHRLRSGLLSPYAGSQQRYCQGYVSYCQVYYTNCQVAVASAPGGQGNVAPRLASRFRARALPPPSIPQSVRRSEADHL